MGRYLPVYKDGGHVRFIKNFVYYISNSVKFEESINKYANNNLEEFNILVSKALLYVLENSNYKVTNKCHRNIFDIKE